MFTLKITGHRGMGVQGKQRNHYIEGADYYPENSMIAFHRAVMMGVDSIEFDIHVTKDGVPVVIHGNELTFYTYRQVDSVEFGPHLVKAKGKVEDYTLSELQDSFRLKLGADRFDNKSEESLKQSIEMDLINEHERNLCIIPKELKQVEEKIKKELKKVPGKDAIEKMDAHIQALHEHWKIISKEIDVLREGNEPIDRKTKQKIGKLQKKITW